MIGVALFVTFGLPSLAVATVWVSSLFEGLACSTPMPPPVEAYDDVDEHHRTALIAAFGIPKEEPDL